MSPRTFLLALLACLTIPALTPGQPIPRAGRTAPTTSAVDRTGLAALAALRRLQAQVIVYRSLSEFEADGRLAYVSLQTFEDELLQVTAQLEQTLQVMPDSKAKTALINAFASYRDGAYWWRKVDRPRVVHVSTLKYEKHPTAGEEVLMSATPYTVTIHWRQAAKYLRRAEELIESR